MREVESSYHKNNPKAIQAIDIYTYQIAKYIGSYATILGDIDAIVFSGGIGENSPFIRAKIIDRVSTLLNLEIDQSKNTQPTTTPTIISTNNSSIPITIIPTDEELQMAVEVELLGVRN
jgi:acetate kinase